MRLHSCVAFALLLVAGATSCSSANDLDKQLDTVASWTATLQLASAELRGHVVSNVYVAQLGDEAREARADASKSLPTAEHDARDRQRAAAAVDSLDRAIATLDAEARR